MTTRGLEPVVQDGQVVRSGEILRLFKDEVINSTTISYTSPSLMIGAFRHFLLHLDIDSTSTPTTLRVEVQFGSDITKRWHTFKQDLFASLYWEDTDVASGVQECFQGLCAGRLFRIKLTGAGVDSTKYFTVSASVEFFN